MVATSVVGDHSTRTISTRARSVLPRLAISFQKPVFVNVAVTGGVPLVDTKTRSGWSVRKVTLPSEKGVCAQTGAANRRMVGSSLLGSMLHNRIAAACHR